MSESTQENFSREEEVRSNQKLRILSAILMIVFLAMGFLKVPSSLSHHLWFAFALACFGGVLVFSLVAKKDAETA